MRIRGLVSFIHFISHMLTDRRTQRTDTLTETQTNRDTIRAKRDVYRTATTLERPCTQPSYWGVL